MMKSISHRIKNHESLRFLHVYFNLCDTTPLDSPHVLLCQRCHLMDRHSAPADDTSIWSVRTAVIRRLCVAARSLKYSVVINFLRDRQTNRHRQPKEEIALVSFRIQSAVHFQETKYHLLSQDLIQMSWNPRLRHCQDFFFFFWALWWMAKTEFRQFLFQFRRWMEHCDSTIYDWLLTSVSNIQKDDWKCLWVTLIPFIMRGSPRYYPDIYLVDFLFLQ